jgi:hypothetical protein
MYFEKEKKAEGNWTSFGKLVVVGTIAVVCGLAVIFSGSQSNSSGNLLSLQSGYSPETEQAYLEYLAKFGKQYANRYEINANFENLRKLTKSSRSTTLTLTACTICSLTSSLTSHSSSSTALTPSLTRSTEKNPRSA